MVASRCLSDVLDAVWFSSLLVSEKRRLLAQVVGCVADLAALVLDGASGARMDETRGRSEVSQLEEILDFIGGGSRVTSRRQVECVRR